MTSSGSSKSKPVIWRFFTSLRLTLALLIVLALVSIAGTLLPPPESAAEWAQSLPPFWVRAVSVLGLFDLYHALWFRLILCLLALNLLVCSLERFPGTWKRFRLLPRPDRHDLFAKAPQRRQLHLRMKPEGLNAPLEALVRGHGRRFAKAFRDGNAYFYTEKGRFSLFGVYLVHASVLIILLGALIGSFFGFQGYVNILEGQTIDHIHLRSGGDHALGFELTCRAFSVAYYPDGVPEEYRSDLVFRQGEQTREQSLRVNHPVDFDGLRFYQANYGTIPGKQVRLRLEREASPPEAGTRTAELGQPMALPGAEGTFTVTDIVANLMGHMGPAVGIEIRPHAGEPVFFWVFADAEDVRRRFGAVMAHAPRLNPAAFPPYTFFVEEIEQRYYTGLQVNKDPGVPVVWLGCSLMILGFATAFLGFHRRIWVRLAPAADGSVIDLAGVASKNPVGLERELDALEKGIHNTLEAGV